MHTFDNEEHKEREMTELEVSKKDLIRMTGEKTTKEIDHVFSTIRLAEEAIKHDWYSLFICHKTTIAAGMDLIFARLSADF